jgi:hypothetical protein
MQKKGMGSFLARQYPNGHVSNGGRGERRDLVEGCIDNE